LAEAPLLERKSNLIGKCLLVGGQNRNCIAKAKQAIIGKCLLVGGRNRNCLAKAKQAIISRRPSSLNLENNTSNLTGNNTSNLTGRSCFFPFR